MKALTVFPVIILALLAVAGCKKVQLGGPVTGATIHIDLLNQRGASYQFAQSTDTANAIDRFGLFEWVGFSGIEQMVWLGNFEVDSQLVQPGALYLVTATGGLDTDANHDRRLDLTAAEVMGEWHAIMMGKSLLSTGSHVSALTEAAYQSVRDRIGYISDAELLTLLDEFAARVVQDVNRDGRVNYTDLLVFSRVFSAANYPGVLDLLDSLAAAIRDDAPDYVLRAAAQSVERNSLVPPVPPVEQKGTRITSNITGNALWTRAGSPYHVPSQLSISGDLRLEPGAIVQGKASRIFLYGNLLVEGLARQPVELASVNIFVSNYGPGSNNILRNANLSNVLLDFSIQHLLVEGCDFRSADITVSNGQKSDDSAAVMRGNSFTAGRLTLRNSSPARPAFELTFANNFFKLVPDVLFTFTTSWEGPAGQLVVQNNTFNANMRFLRATTASTLDLRNNYWGAAGFPGDTIDDIIPDNTVMFGTPQVQYRPFLSSAHPDTPGGL